MGPPRSPATSCPRPSRPPTTGKPSSSRRASRQWSGCSSSTSRTRVTSAPGSPASTTPTTPRNRVLRPCETPPRLRARTPSFRSARSPCRWRAPASISAMSEPDRGQYVAYTFYRVDPAWRRLPVEERHAMKDAFAEVVERWTERMESLRSYSTAGVRPDCDFFLWKITERYLDLQELGAELNSTPLAGWLSTPYSYLATTKASQYTSARKARKIALRSSPYLVVYPFVKVRAWYA